MIVEAENLAASRQLYQTVQQILIAEYGYPTWRQHLPPVDELVSTILSQSTSDTNRDKGFYALKAHYPNWESVRDAPVVEIEAVIRPSGLAAQKAPRIKKALQTVTERIGSLNLDFLATLPIEEAKTWLISLDGVGPKTAAIILLFCFNRPAFPVDTHVHRVSGRVGWISAKMSADKAHGVLESLADPSNYYADHLNLIRHGREVCHARRPACEVCPLREHCHYYQTNKQEGDNPS